MRTGSIDESQRAAARVVGVVFPVSFAIVVWVNFGILGQLIIGADPAQTARNVLAHETLFRVGVAGDVLYCMGVFILSAALYVVLKPVDQYLALVAALGRLVHGFTWVLVTVNLFTALRLLTDPSYARVFPPDQLPFLGRLYLSGFDSYYVGLAFWSVGAAVGAYLWFKSRYVPRALSAFGLLASAWCAACTFALFLFPEFPKTVNLWWFDMPMVLFEIALSVLLLFRGLRPFGVAVDQPQNLAGGAP